MDTINAYVLSKQHKDSDKTQLLLETHGTNLECDYVVSYKEFEPAAPKPKKVVEPKEKKPRAKKEKHHEWLTLYILIILSFLETWILILLLLYTSHYKHLSTVFKNK